MNVSEKSLIGRVNGKAATFIELCSRIVEEFCCGKRTQIPWIPVVVGVFGVSILLTNEKEVSPGLSHTWVQFLTLLTYQLQQQSYLGYHY